nr:chitobiase/beta-hexosaminidase C-terminal domain-containing protein [Syntrophorhabdaceae bacterium]
ALPNAAIRYTTDGSDPKEYGVDYDSEIIVPKDAVLILAVAEVNGIYSGVEEINIDRTRESTVEIDKQKPLKLKRKQKTNDIAETYKELDLLEKHRAKISDIAITLYKTDEKSNQKGWIEISTDESTIVDIDKLKDTIDNIRNNFLSESKVSITLECNKTIFESGRYFLDWVAEKKMLLSNFSKEEIIQ